MSQHKLSSLLIGLAMIATALAAVLLTPTTMLANTNDVINLNRLIPVKFGDWNQQQELEMILSPKDKAVSGKIYEQTLSRTYTNKRGEQIMLTIAYGNDQRDGMQVHKPEACYPAQGFKIIQSNTGYLTLTKSGNEIPVRRLVAVQGRRHEPITYWITVGNQIALGGLQWKLAQLKYGLTGKVPDGLLFRVSSIDRNYDHAFKTQIQFINDLFNNLTKNAQVRLAGSSAWQTTHPNDTLLKL
jgi:EpsI family protein